MKHPPFANAEFYHIYNRGVDRRQIFSDQYDLQRFLQSMDEFNVFEPIGSIYELSFLDQGILSKRKKKRLVNFIAYCLNPNHIHFVIQQVREGGVSELMKRLFGGYTWHFNKKHNRSGSLFQGTFKAKHIDSNEYLLHLSAYVNLNHRAHQLGGLTAKLCKSSWDEFIDRSADGFCNKNIILEQFRSSREYRHFAESSLKDIVERKNRDKEFGEILLE